MWGSNAAGSSSLVLDDIKCWIPRWDLISLLCSLHGVLSSKYVSILTHDHYMTAGMRLHCPFRGLEMFNQQRGSTSQSREAGDQNTARGSILEWPAPARLCRRPVASAAVLTDKPLRREPIDARNKELVQATAERPGSSRAPPAGRPFVHLHRRAGLIPRSPALRTKDSGSRHRLSAWYYALRPF